MKKTFHTILFCLAILSFPLVGLAKINGEEKKADEQSQEGRSKSSQEEIRPDGNYAPSDNITVVEDEESLEPKYPNSSYGVDKVEADLDSDSLEDDSVSKYNFLFYFLYKFKYDSEESP
ncbi:MAG: hypothetical protein HRT61_01710 [Ekhidna sp.]|nr:hypothetical protein [Ekhidna sp.]